MSAVATPPSTEILSFLERFSPEVREIALRARELILGHRPDAVETLWPGWKMIGYGTAPCMKGLVCGIGPVRERVNLVVMGATDIPHPDGLFVGSGKTGRTIRLDSPERLESPEVAAMLERIWGRAAGGGAPAPATAGELPVSDEAVRAKTGRGWAEWIETLDAAGAADLPHPEIVKLLERDHAVEPWWRQMVTVGYERARGRRVQNQTSSGYQVGASKTVSVPIARLFQAWTDEGLRDRWLPGARFTVRKATPEKSMRITWEDGSSLDVLFYAKGEAKSQVTVDQRKLPDADAVERVRAFWRERLERLKEVVER